MYTLTASLLLLLPYVSLIFSAEGFCMELLVGNMEKKELSELGFTQPDWKVPQELSGPMFH